MSLLLAGSALYLYSKTLILCIETFEVLLVVLENYQNERGSLLNQKFRQSEKP